MKIISKYKDYYDYLTQIYGVDDVVVYRRMPIKIELKKYRGDLTTTYSISKEDFETIKVTRLQIWFCDKNYPCFEVEYNKGYFPYTVTEVYYYYSYQSFMERWGFAVKESDYRKSQMEDHFKIELKDRLNTYYNTPQLRVEGDVVTTDIILRDFSFNKIISPEQAYQRVFMFMNSKPDPPQTVPTEMHRFEAKGFDKKTSFRKPKEDKNDTRKRRRRADKGDPLLDRTK